MAGFFVGRPSGEFAASIHMQMLKIIEATDVRLDGTPGTTVAEEPSCAARTASTSITEEPPAVAAVAEEQTAVATVGGTGEQSGGIYFGREHRKLHPGAILKRAGFAGGSDP